MRTLIADRVVHRFGSGPPVLDELGLTIGADGSSTAIMAPSGAGKTTLLSIAGGLLRPSGGEVYVRDEQGTRSSVRNHVAWCFQTTNMLGRRSTLDNTMFAALARGLSFRRAQAAAVMHLERVGLSAKQSQSARTLSGGEAQRLGVARALAGGADFVLADEPTGQLDDQTTEDVMSAVLEAIREASSSALIVTHDRRVAESCDRILHLENGRLVQ